MFDLIAFASLTVVCCILLGTIAGQYSEAKYRCLLCHVHDDSLCDSHFGLMQLLGTLVP